MLHKLLNINVVKCVGVRKFKLSYIKQRVVENFTFWETAWHTKGKMCQPFSKDEINRTIKVTLSIPPNWSFDTVSQHIYLYYPRPFSKVVPFSVNTHT